MDRNALAAVAIALAILASALYLTQRVSVAPTESEKPPRAVVVDLANRTVELPAKIERVIVLTSAEAEVLCALGVGDKIVGIGKYIPNNEYLPDYVKNKTVVGSTFAGVNLEAALALEPDLVITQYGYGKTAEIVERFEEVGVPVLCVQLREFDDLLASIRLLGEVFEREERAEELVEFLSSVFERIREIALSIPEEERVGVLMMGRIKEGMITVYARGSAWASLVELAGARNVAFEEEFPTPWPKVSLEKIIEWNPDVVIVVAFEKEDLEARIQAITTSEEWRVLKAVREGRVYGVLAGSKFGAFLEWSPRLAVGAVQIADLIYPEYFGGLDWKEVADELLRRFYGLNFTRAVVDDHGRLVEVPCVVERIALLDGGVGEVVLALGAGDRVCAISWWHGYKLLWKLVLPNLDELPVVFTQAGVDVEALEVADPDVAILWWVGWEEITEQIEEQAGVPVINVWIDSVDDLYRDIELVGEILGLEDRARALVGDLEESVEMVSERTSDIPPEERPKVLWIVWYSGPDEPFSVVGDAGLMNEMIELAGGTNVVQGVGKSWVEPSIEQIVAWNPDVIFFRVRAGANLTAEDLLDDPRFAEIKGVVSALKYGRVYKLPSWSTWSPRGPLVVLRAAMYLYPDRFADLSFDEIASEFFAKWYGIQYSPEMYTAG